MKRIKMKDNDIYSLESKYYDFYRVKDRSGNKGTAFVFDKPMGILNFVHRNPPTPANYTVSIEHVSGEGSHTVTSGSLLLLGIKR